MKKNEILIEVWRSRDAFARRHGYDLDAMVAELRRRERRSPNPLVDRSERTSKRRLQRTPEGLRG